MSAFADFYLPRRMVATRLSFDKETGRRNPVLEKRRHIVLADR
ncbi:hypothetical protein [Yunchengibacter salinarum]